MWLIHLVVINNITSIRHSSSTIINTILSPESILSVRLCTCTYVRMYIATGVTRLNNNISQLDSECLQS